MSVRIGRAVVAIAVATLAVGVPATTAAAAGGCSAYSVVLGQGGSLTGPTTTDWFNVFGEHLDPAGSWTVRFSVPVMPWPYPWPLTYDPTKAVSSLAIPTNPTGGFKWTVRTLNTGVDALRIQVSDGKCTASHLVVLVPNTGTDRQPSDQPFPLLAALIGAALGALFVLRPTRRNRLGPASDIGQH